MWLKFKVLLWKSLQLRKRHWFFTIIELLFPCFVFYMLYYVKTNTGNGSFEDTKYLNQILSPISEQSLFDDFTKTHSKHSYFIYTPKTLETKQIMKLVGKSLDIPSDNIDAVENESKMIQKFKNKFNSSKEFKFSHNGFGIVFEEVKKSLHIFKYKIRSTNDVWKTDLLFPDEETPGPMNSGIEYLEKGFLALQLMLDKTFISMALAVTGNKTIGTNDYNLSIQPYPYAKYKEDLQFQQSFKELLPLFTIFGFLIMCSQTIKKVVDEKDSGVKELMKMMGLKSWMIWTGWILHNLFVYSITITIITYITCFEVHKGSGKLLNYTNPLLFWTFLITYIISGMFFCFSISSLFNRPLISLMVGNMIWILSYSLTQNFLKPSTHILIKTCFMLFPNVAVLNGFTAISTLESLGIGLQFSTLFTTVKGDRSFSVGFILLMLIVDCFLYGFIAWYMDSIMPGKYGIAKPLNFFCDWSSSKPVNKFKMDTNKTNSKLFEKPPNGYNVGIRVKNLYKQFGNFNAVNGVNLDLYKGHITALLGHNGAGKTTTMSIITGLFSPSSGSVEVNGHDLFSNIDKFRKNLGLCPQHNLLFSYLTTLEHLIFFGMLKGISMEKAKSEGLHLLKVLNILQKKDELVRNLSGGMKRKVSLAIALVGSPEVLILDEPTSGMDPESRREMWNLLLSFRGTRTILITTHFMEEADVLGDRIAIMDHGQIKCYGTSLFLKKIYGTGYNLTIINEGRVVSKIVEEIEKIIPEAEVQNGGSAQLSINLPNSYINKFPVLFEMLETNRTEFGIQGMGISCTTMEEVFLRAEKSTLDDNSDKLLQPQKLTVHDLTETLPKYTNGINLLKNQLIALLEKKILYTYRRWFMSLIFGLVPILVGILTVKSSNSLFNYSDIPPSLDISLSTYKDSSVIYRVGDNSSQNLGPIFEALIKKNQGTASETSPTHYIINDLLKICNRDVFKYRSNLMIGGDFNKTKSTVIYNNIAIHTPAIAINLYTNALLQKLSKNNKSHISTVNEPISLENTINGVCDTNFVMDLVILWFSIFTPGLLYLVGYFMALPLSERVSGIKQLQMMTKLSPIMYWTTCFLWDFFCYTIVIILTLMAMYLFDTNHVFTSFNELSILFTLQLIFGWSVIFYAYTYSFSNKNLGGSMLLFISVNSIIGLFINNGMYILKNVIKEKNKISPYNFWNIFRYITLINPYFSYSSCIAGFLEITWENKRCQICTSSNMQVEGCIGSIDSKQKRYFEFASDKNKSGIMEETLFLFFSSTLYISILLLLDYKVLAKLYQFCFNAIVGTDIGYKGDFEDPDVGHEKDRVDAAKTKNISYDVSPPILVVDNLVKKFGFKFTGVRGISFAVSPGECFGLLGVNGAGKTTTFRILTGDTFPSQGDAFIQFDKQYKLSSDTNQYVSMIGYCPQFDAINDQLTGSETLKLMAILRGVSPLNAKYHVDKWITLLGLEEYKDKLCGNYSGGNKRKLNTAMALIGDPPVVFLDEPTSGVDPAARRNLWRLLAASQKAGQAVVLTSHSMDECEALCNRLTIMVDGVMKCIGNIQYLKNRYGQGFTVMVKLLNTENIDLASIKSDIEQCFTPGILLKDEHQGLLHYHITNSQVKLSEIFSKMKTIKENYSAVEDYTVSDTTLEQVFIAFAKRQAIVNLNSN